MIETSIVTCSTRQCGVEPGARRVPETRGDVAVRPQQIGGAGFGIVARGSQPCGIDKTILAADTDHPDTVRRVNRNAIGKLEQCKPRSRSDEGFGQKRKVPGARGAWPTQPGPPPPPPPPPRISIST